MFTFRYTMASMVIVVNSVVGGAAVALAVALAARATSPVPALTGITVGLIVLALGLCYEHRRLTPAVLSSPTTQIG